MTTHPLSRPSKQIGDLFTRYARVDGFERQRRFFVAHLTGSTQASSESVSAGLVGHEQECRTQRVPRSTSQNPLLPCNNLCNTVCIAAGRIARPPRRGVSPMADSMQVGSVELAALRARLSEREVCPSCGQDDPWKRCKDAD